MTPIIRQPDTIKEFETYYDLRWSLLRQPWNQPKGSEKDELEDEGFHIMACDENNKLIGIGRLHFNNEMQAQIRYMAVLPEYRNKGVGKSILEMLEKKARHELCKTVLLEARESALKFYENQGYDIIKKSHLLYNDIQHYRMMKKL